MKCILISFKRKRILTFLLNFYKRRENDRIEEQIKILYYRYHIISIIVSKNKILPYNLSKRNELIISDIFVLMYELKISLCRSYDLCKKNKV